MPYAGHLLLEG